MSQQGAIVGLGGREDYLALDPSFRPERASLSPEEHALLALVGRASRISEVLAKSGLKEPVAIAALLSLRAKGAVRPARVEHATPSPMGDAALSEEVDLPLERKKEILELEQRLASPNHFELLGLVPGSDREAVKNAYHQASLKFHPDRYFQRNLGSYRARLDRIFRRLSEANAVLTDDAKRSAFLKAHPEFARTPTIGSIMGSGKTPPPVAAPTEVELARNAERRARLAKHPYLAKTGKLSDLLTKSRAHLAKGEFDLALTALSTLVQIDPNSREAPPLLAEARRGMEIRRAKELTGRARDALNLGHEVDALATFRSAASLDPTQGEAALQAARLLLKLKGDSKEAKLLASRAVELLPKSPEPLVVLGMVHLELNQKKAAKKNFEDALAREPEHAEAKKHLKNLRWVF